MTSAEGVPLDEIRVVTLKVSRREHMATKYLRPEPGRVGLQDAHHVVGVLLAHVIPAATVGYLQREHAHLHPQDVLALGRARRIGDGWLPHDESRRCGQRACCSLGVGHSHVVEVRADMHVVEGACLRITPLRQLIECEMNHHRGQARLEFARTSNLALRGNGIRQHVGHQ